MPLWTVSCVLLPFDSILRLNLLMCFTKTTAKHQSELHDLRYSHVHRSNILLSLRLQMVQAIQVLRFHLLELEKVSVGMFHVFGTLAQFLLLFYGMERLWALHDVLVARYWVKESHLGVLFVFGIIAAVCSCQNLHIPCVQAPIFVSAVEAYTLCFICWSCRLTVQNRFPVLVINIPNSLPSLLCS